MNNYAMEKYRQDLINLTNNSNLVVGAAYFIMKDVLSELAIAYQNSIAQDKNNSEHPKTVTETEEIPIIIESQQESEE